MKVLVRLQDPDIKKNPIQFQKGFDLMDVLKL